LKDKYRENLPLPEALYIWEEALRNEGIGVLGDEVVQATTALGRVTAAPVFARSSNPNWHSAAMDGYAVRAADTFGAGQTRPMRLRVDADAVLIDTGKPLPEGFDAVIMHEDLFVAEGFIELTSPVHPWKNVRLAGEDIVATELIVPENHRLRPTDIAAILSGGVTGIRVRKRPVAAIIPTGSDLVPAGKRPARGEITESNSAMLAGLAAGCGAEAAVEDIVPDDPDSLSGAMNKALGESDVLIINAGASLGAKDYTFECVERLGRVVVHGVSTKPGKPVILGIANGKPVIGTPGYPVSTYLSFNLFVKPLLYALQGVEPPPPVQVEGVLSRNVPSALGHEEFIRVKAGKVGDNIVVTPLARGAGQLMSLVRADGFLRVPPMSEGIGQGTVVKVELLEGRTPSDMENTLVVIGSHDNAIDIVANFLKRKHPSFSLSSAHVGSMGGLLALGRGEAHCAPTHLLDEETGQYNVPFIKKLLPDKKVTLINLVYREQGLMVLKGNPKDIRGFEDLSREDVRFINRQGGSGTRLLLDKHLRELGIDPSGIKGYEKEEVTHMAVASAVLTGVAEAGLGVLSAANALGLDFVPVARERYDLAIPAEFLGLPVVKAMLEIIREDAEFRKTLLDMGGYGLEDMGKAVYGS
jgi:putative molybdopterin biosynthesis protein